MTGQWIFCKMNCKNMRTPTISKRRKLIASLPFFIIVALLINTWYKFWSGEYEASLIHYITMVLVVINGALLAIRFKPALLMTGAILVFASLGLLYFFDYYSPRLTIFGLTIPFDGWSFLILIIYIAVNFRILIEWLLDARGVKPLSESNADTDITEH
jgi:hypothetical protein